MSELSAPPSPAPPLSVGESFARFGAWCRREPLSALLLTGVVGVLVYFFGFFKVFVNGVQSTYVWGWDAWNEGNDLEHGSLILPGAILVVWMHREALRRSVKRPSIMGLAPLLVGILGFLVSVWTLQPRIALVALPFLILGCVWFLWGRETARLVLFPCALLLFMVPVGFLLGHTEPLQRLVAAFVHGLTRLLHLGIERDGVKLLAADGSFQCEVAGGCSGIRSLMAMTMLAACYVHFTQKGLWKKVLIFAVALPCAVVGNMVRVFTIVLVAKFISPAFGTGVWHDISGFLVTIPIAVFAMVQFAALLNLDWGRTVAGALKPTPPKAADGKAPSPITYDY